MKELETVVSKTDLNGNITYVNQEFISISGFSEEELIGVPQNIVRHPDMSGIVTSDIQHTSSRKNGSRLVGLTHKTVTTDRLSSFAKNSYITPKL